MKNEFSSPNYYENRELSWLLFNRRILNEARDRSNPLMERLKFLSITASNLDEFMMVRVASLKDMVHAGYHKKDLAGYTPQEQLDAIGEEVHDFMDLQYTTLNRSLLPLIKKEGIVFLSQFEDLSEKQGKYVDDYFEENVYPVLTPMAVDASRPFPLIPNKSLNIAALLTKKKDSSTLLSGKSKSKYDFATVTVPAVLPRVIELPSEEEGVSFFLPLEQVIEKNIGKLFLNYKVECAYPYRIMRNADLSIDEDEASDLLKEIQKQLKRREWGEVIRLEIESGMDQRLVSILKENLNVKNAAIFEVNGPIDLTFLMKIYDASDNPKLYDKPYTPAPVDRLPAGCNIFDEIRKGDIFMQHPYDSFEPVVRFIQQAATDDQVLAIKQTLYRVSGNSPIIAALAKAAENGKQVTVLVELKARFDEENNIVWAKKLEKAGCHVIYGLVGLKTHSKIALVVRREEDGIVRYVHLGTGNYNDSTAKIYTDCGLFTCRELIGEDATAVFNMLSGYSEPAVWNRLIVAPLWLRRRFYELIDRETAHAREGKPARIVAKMNSLCDKEMIEHLYEASSAGVEIYLIIRGICCLRTGIPKVSENIHVMSIVGRFLEHSRIFYFYNDGAEDIYMGSADWMPRNLDRRVEIIFPVEDEDIKEKVKHILSVELSDNMKAYFLDSDGTYRHFDRRGKKAVGSQMQFCREATHAAKKKEKEPKSRLFIPIWAVPEDEN